VTVIVVVVGSAVAT